MLEFAIDTGSQAGANFEKAGLQGAGAAVELPGVFVEGGVFGVTLFDQGTVIVAQLVQAAAQGGLDVVDFPGLEGGLIGEGADAGSGPGSGPR